MVDSRTYKTIVLSLGKTLATFSSILAGMVLARLFTKNEFATYRQTLLVFNLLTPLWGMGLSNALMYFLATAEKRTRTILVENLTPLSLFGLFSAAFFLAGGNRWLAASFHNSQLATTLVIMAPFSLFALPVGSLSACLISRDRTTQAAIFATVSRSLSLLLVIVAAVMFRSPESAIAATVVAAGFTVIVALNLMFRACQDGPWRPTWGGIKEQLAYGIPLGLSSLVGTLSWQMDQLMVSAMTSAAEYASYAAGAVELPLVSVITGSITSVLIVDYRKMLAEGKTAEVLSLLHRATIRSATVLIPTMMLLLCVAPEFMTCLFGEKYRSSALVFRIYLLLLPVRTLVFSSIGLAAGRTKALAIVPLVSVGVNCVLNYFAITWLGSYGAAIATIVTTYSVSAYGRALIGQDVLKCTIWEFIPWRGMGRLMAVSSVALPLVLLTQHWLPWSRVLADEPFAEFIRPLLILVATSLIYAIVTVPLLVRTGFVDPEKIRQRISSFRRKK